MIKGRITKGVGGNYEVVTSQGLYNCTPRGLFRKDNIKPLIGDIVDVDIVNEEEKIGVIWTIEERTSELLRPHVANVTQGVLYFSIKKPNLNIDLLNKFIVSCERQNLSIIIAFSKTDLLKTDKEKEEFNEIVKIYNEAGFETVEISVEDRESVNRLHEKLKGHISVVAGPSGTGKSSFINMILPHAQMEVGEISKKISRGKHTTRHTQLFRDDQNTYILDSPGFTSLYIDDLEKWDLQWYFREISKYAPECKFSDCVHINEPQCKVKEKLEEGIISKSRYRSYLSIYKELEEKENIY